MFKETMIEAINNKNIVVLTFKSASKGIITRRCIPFDIGPGRIDNYKTERFHFYNLDSPDGQHNLSILEGEITSLNISPDTFKPADYVKWTPNWSIKRDWGNYS